MHQRCSHQTDFHEVWYWGLSGKSVQQLQNGINSDKIIGFFSWRPKYVAWMPATFSCHKSSLSGWNGFSLLRSINIARTRHEFLLYVHCLSCYIVYTVFHRIISPGLLAQCQTYVSHSGSDTLKPEPTEKCDVFLFLRIVIWIPSFTNGTAKLWANIQLLFHIWQTPTLAVIDSNLFQFTTRQLILAMAIHLPLAMYHGRSTGTESRPSRKRIIDYQSFLFTNWCSIELS
jgi:hypothetical protein